jgi:HPr kinase/phosphorylase
MGASGSGKSALAAQLIALGAQLVSDDRTEVCAINQSLIASPPSTIAGLIELRGLGIVKLPYCAGSKVCAVIDLSEPATEQRLPPPRHKTILGIDVDFLHWHGAAHFPSKVMCYLMGERHE